MECGEHHPLPLLPLPLVHDALHSPRRSYDILNRTPVNCMHSFAVLSIRLFRAASHARNAQYGCTERTLQQSRIAYFRGPIVQERLCALHLPPLSPVSSLNATDLSFSNDISEAEVLRAVRRLDQNSAPGHDRMSLLLLNFLTNTRVTLEAGLTRISVLSSVFGDQLMGTSLMPQSLS